MTKPALNQLIEWDGSETPPVPVGTDVTIWCRDVMPVAGKIVRFKLDAASNWEPVTAYMVHAYPPEDEVEEYNWFLEAIPDPYTGELRPRICFDGLKDISGFAVSRIHLRFTNGVAEIVSQEKA